ncbi:2-hydroxy-3-carboxy-6-oxo-7-methylocta-2, 4-dienoate decarboxylase [Kutzneria sp. CA-103260]|nr:2-hydroxy-3-carboxy-6-oxo-7-methylocta-2, 4-dienoate decarboxylase [Kutzneria sp. CA-103260]
MHAHLAPRHDLAPISSDVPSALYDPDELARWLDLTGFAEAVVSVPPPFFRQHLPEEAAARWVEVVNDGICAAVRGYPRLRPLGYLPLEHPELAVAEYERLCGLPVVGVCGSAGGGSVSLADPRFAPLWRALDRDGRMLMLHPGTAPDPRLKAFYLANLLGNPTETALAAAQLIFGDVLARHPGMRVLLVHCGGAVPAMIGRWQRGYDTSRPGIKPLLEPPREMVRRLYVDCLAHDPLLVRHAVAVFGPDKLVVGSDWPFAMGLDDPRGQIRDLGLDDAVTANAVRLLGL